MVATELSTGAANVDTPVPQTDVVYEIERKFVLKKPPKGYRKYPFDDIVQGYTEDDVRYREARGVEKIVYTRAVKSGKGVVRQEDEGPISRDEFQKVWPTTKDGRLRKRRHFIPYKIDGEEVSGVEIHLDILRKNGKKRKLKGKVIAEVEFSTVELSGTFIAPNWFRNKKGEVREVTGVNGYSCKDLARDGWPKKRKNRNRIAA